MLESLLEGSSSGNVDMINKREGIGFKKYGLRSKRNGENPEKDGD